MNRYPVLAIMLLMSFPAYAQQPPNTLIMPIQNQPIQSADDIPQPNIPYIRIGEPTEMIQQKLKPAGAMVDQQILIQKQAADQAIQQNQGTVDEWRAANPDGAVPPLPEEHRRILQDMSKAGMAGESSKALDPMYEQIQ